MNSRYYKWLTGTEGYCDMMEMKGTSENKFEPEYEIHADGVKEIKQEEKEVREQ